MTKFIQPGDLMSSDALNEVTLKLEDLTLSFSARNKIMELVAEQKSSNELRSNGLEPSNSILMVGKRGDQQEWIAEGIANELSYKFLVITHDTLLGRDESETAVKIDELINHINTFSFAVIFFDAEFDKTFRVTYPLLRRMTKLRTNCVLVVSHSDKDNLRNMFLFDIMINVPRPTTVQIQEVLQKLCGSKIENGVPEYLHRSEFSFSDLIKTALRVKRLSFLNPGVPVQRIVESTVVD